LENNNFDAVLDFIENDVNSFRLLTTWTRFNIKKKYADEKKKNVSEVTIKSQNFSESVIRKLQQK